MLSPKVPCRKHGYRESNTQEIEQKMDTEVLRGRKEYHVVQRPSVGSRKCEVLINTLGKESHRARSSGNPPKELRFVLSLGVCRKEREKESTMNR